jgi:hypothetical protein
MKGVFVLISSVPILAAIMQPAPGPPPNDHGRDLAGLYACEGLGPDGATYRGMVEIVRQEEAYAVLWVLPPHGQHLGLGLVTGDVLAVSYFSNPPGIVAYQIEHDGGQRRLVGRWTEFAASGRVFTETLTALSDDETALLPPREPLASPHGPDRRPNRGAPPHRGLTPLRYSPIAWTARNQPAGSTWPALGRTG